MTGETAAEAEITEKVGCQISIELPPAVIRAEVHRVRTANPGGGVTDVNHGLVAGGVVIDRPPGTRKPACGKSNPRIPALSVAQCVCENAGQIERVDIGLNRSRSVLIGSGFYISEAKLVDEVLADSQ